VRQFSIRAESRAGGEYISPLRSSFLSLRGEARFDEQRFPAEPQAVPDRLGDELGAVVGRKCSGGPYSRSVKRCSTSSDGT